jgi:hypothetical protein
MNGFARVCCLTVILAAAPLAFAEATMNSLLAASDVTPDTNPTSEFWRNAPHVLARLDAGGKPVGRYATEVRSRWTTDNLYFLFICPYKVLYLKPTPATEVETNQLWNWDVAEVFLGSDFKDIRRYKEFEISPQAEWIDLDVDLHKPHHEDGWVWNSGFQVAARIDRAEKIWYGAMRIPFGAIAPVPPRPGMEFRMNLFRSEGPPSKGQAITWQPPLTATFHTPERFGLLRLVAGGEAATLAAARDYYLQDLIRPHDYSPGKNSFLLRGLEKGQRRTILDLSGTGSVRHIWSTWSIPGQDSTGTMAPPGKVRLRVFVDGAAPPAIEGPVDELCRAAEATGSSYVPLPAFNFKGAYNFYLPISFIRGVRIEVEAMENLEEFYTQIDYRLSPHEVQEARLVSERTSGGLALQYVRRNPPPDRTTDRQRLRYGITGGNELSLIGPGILRALSFRGDLPSDAKLEIYWDDDRTPSVDAPIGFFFADFVNAAVESDAQKKTCYFPMPFRRKARVIVSVPAGSPPPEGIEYVFEPASVANMPYFHALYRASEKTSGYTQYSVLQVRGGGLFVGANLFDTGHNHGGGDSALIDAGSAQPRVLHGICGEDYFSFAWHQTGVMTPLTGAPAHGRRYRLHLENPYPFSESLQFLFGVFAGTEPKSVAFWYQVSEVSPRSEWLAPDVPWKALGPLGTETAPSRSVGDETYDTTISFRDPVKLHEKAQDAGMIHGFADLTYLFRHYVFASSGTGYVAGAGRTQLTTHVFSPKTQTLDALFGHDDGIAIAVNGEKVASFAAHPGFSASPARLALRQGWNTLEVIVLNDENINWRWCGLSFAVRRGAARDLQFSGQARANAR